MNLKKILKESAIIAVFGLASTGIVAGIIEQGKYERTRREVQLKIDTDHNGLIMPEEWGPVYKFLDVKPKEYSIGNGLGLDLSRAQLEKYLGSINK